MTGARAPMRAEEFMCCYQCHVADVVHILVLARSCERLHLVHIEFDLWCADQKHAQTIILLSSFQSHLFEHKLFSSWHLSRKLSRTTFRLKFVGTTQQQSDETRIPNHLPSPVKCETKCQSPRPSQTQAPQQLQSKPMLNIKSAFGFVCPPV